jgi:tetratricopeptide (TPR) repeat protein
LLDKFEATAPKDFIDPEMKKSEELVRVIVTTYHKEISVTKEEATMEFTHRLYNEYLRLFPDSPEFAAMTLNYAILLEQLKKYAEAAERYGTVADLKPDPDTALEAAHGAVRAYYQMLDMARQKAKSEDSADLEPKELPEFETKLVAASERYLRIAKPDSPDVVEAQYAAAMVLYQHNQFRMAADGFRRIAMEHGEHPNAPDAARLLLSSLALMRDIPGLNSAADLVGGNPRLMQGDVPQIVRRINEQKDFNKCFEYEQAGRNTIAAECFLDYVKRFPGTPLKDRSLINAANNFFKARLVERSLEANQQLVNEMPDSPLSPRALFNIADTYRRLAVYSEAARIYEIFVSLQPKHELTEEALRYATIFRTGLGEYDLAIKDLRRYLQLFPKAEYAASVAQEIAITLQKQGKFPEAQREFEKWLSQYGKAAGLDLYLRAHLRIGQCHAKQRGGTAKSFEWYARTVTAYEALTDDEKSKVTSVGLSAVAEARFNEGEALLERMAAIKLRLPEKVLAEAIAQKIQLVTQAIELLASVEDLGQPNWAIAAWSRRGFAFQDLATSIENSPVPGNLNQEQRLYFRQGLGDRALPIWDRAKDSFRRCVELAKELKWYNRYSDEAEDALMKLDPEFRSLPDIRPLPNSFTLNQGRPPLMIEKEGLEVPKWDDANLDARIKANAEAPDASAEAYYNMGALLRSKGDSKGARIWYGKALAKNPRLANAEARLGVIALDEGRESEAVAQFEKSMQIDPANSIANNYFAAKALRARNHAEAISLARKGLVSDPDSMDAYQILMAAYLDMGLPDVGILVGRNAVGIYGNDGPIQNMLGLILLQTGEVRQAVQLFQKAVQDDQNLFDARMNLAAVTLGYRDYNTSSEQFRKAVELRPKDVNARLGLAVARRGAGAAEEALNLLTSLVREHEWAEPHFNLCLVYQENLGQMEKALESCRTFVRMAGGSHEKAKEVQRRIEGIQMTIEAMRDMPSPTPAPKNAPE